MVSKKFFGARLKDTFIGKARDISDKSIFHRISLIAFFAWVGLGSDPLSSSCYGPEEIMRNLSGHNNLGIFVAIMTVITIMVISTSYRQIISLFPHGGGGYIVASKLISPTVGMISGSALVIDYVLTITLSISSGADALFSFFPAEWHPFKIYFAFFVLSMLIVMNLRGVKESVMTLTPIFVLFVLTHVFLILYSILTHIPETGMIIEKSSTEMHNTVSELGVFGTLFLILRAYSLGAGTYTGIEAVSNGIPNLREPKVHTAQRTMILLSVSLAIAVFGLIISYYLFNVSVSPTKTLNAVLTETATAQWPSFFGNSFVFLTLFSEAALLFVAAQTGFLDGPRVIANMAADSWLPKRFMHLSDRLVSENGILIMGGAAFILLYVSGGAVSWLIILYSINVFITFTLSQFGMVRHWFQVRSEEKRWFRKMLINGIGLVMTSFILITIVVVKFSEGGWITLVITGIVALFAIQVKRQYNFIRQETIKIKKEVRQAIPDLIRTMKKRLQKKHRELKGQKTRTAVILTNGYDGFGLYTLFKALDCFEENYERLVFIEIGVLDTKKFNKFDQFERLPEVIELDLKKYVYVAEQLGLKGDYFLSLGTDVVEEIDKLIPKITEKYPNPIIIGGQVIYDGNPGLNRVLHDYTLFAIQRKLYRHGLTTLVIPIPLDTAQIISFAREQIN